MAAEGEAGRSAQENAGRGGGGAGAAMAGVIPARRVLYGVGGEVRYVTGDVLGRGIRRPCMFPGGLRRPRHVAVDRAGRAAAGHSEQVGAVTASHRAGCASRGTGLDKAGVKGVGEVPPDHGMNGKRVAEVAQGAGDLRYAPVQVQSVAIGTRGDVGPGRLFVTRRQPAVDMLAGNRVQTGLRFSVATPRKGHDEERQQCGKRQR